MLFFQDSSNRYQMLKYNIVIISFIVSFLLHSNAWSSARAGASDRTTPTYGVPMRSWRQHKVPFSPSCCFSLLAIWMLKMCHWQVPAGDQWEPPLLPVVSMPAAAATTCGRRCRTVSDSWAHGLTCLLCFHGPVEPKEGGWFRVRAPLIDDFSIRTRLVGASRCLVADAPN